MIPWTGTLWQEASSERTAAPTAPYGVARRTEPKMFGLAVRTDAAEPVIAAAASGPAAARPSTRATARKPRLRPATARAPSLVCRSDAAAQSQRLAALPPAASADGASRAFQARL